jgi:Flp pilus assembly protein TadG
MSRCRADHGVATLEVVILTPIVLMLLALVALTARLSAARADVTEAARDAARAATLERNLGFAQPVAEAAVDGTLNRSGLICANRNVTLTITAADPNRAGSVTATVTCEVSLTDLGLIGISGTRQLTATSTSVIDVFRAQ